MNIYKQQWSGSSVPEITKGTATFTCYDETCEITLDSFKDFVNLCNLMDEIQERTQEVLKSRIGYAAKQLIDGIEL